MKIDKVSTRKLEIIGPSGECAMTLDCWDDGKPFIRLFDIRGCERLVVSLDENDQPQFGMLDEEGRTLVGIGVNSVVGTGLNIFDKKGELKLVVSVDPQGNVTLGATVDE